MLHLLLLLVLPQGTDTTVTLRAATALALNSFEGSITVIAGDRGTLRVQADHEDDTEIRIDQGGGRVRISASARYGPAEVNWRLTVPPELALDLTAQSGDVTVSGSKGRIEVSSVEGNVTVRGGSGQVALETVEGDVLLEDANGYLTLRSVDGDITVRGSQGGLQVNTVDGRVTLDGVRSDNVQANTVDGDIDLAGEILPSGRYHLTSHDGDVTITAPSIDADVSISTYSGDFESDFPVTLTRVSERRRMSFTLGKGGARLELESFDGTVALRKGTRVPAGKH